MYKFNRFNKKKGMKYEKSRKKINIFTQERKTEKEK